MRCEYTTHPPHLHPPLSCSPLPLWLSLESLASLSFLATTTGWEAATFATALRRRRARSRYARAFSSLPFLLCETEHPKPLHELFAFGSDPVTVIYMYNTYDLRFFVRKLSGVHVYTPMSYTVAALSLWMYVNMWWELWEIEYQFSTVGFHGSTLNQKFIYLSHNNPELGEMDWRIKPISQLNLANNKLFSLHACILDLSWKHILGCLTNQMQQCLWGNMLMLSSIPNF